jgi:hypothetical protein
MSTLSGSSASRRKFLRDAAIVSAAMAGGVSLPAPAVAAPPAAAGEAKKLNLGFAPDAGAAGAVLVPTNFGIYATFRAMVSNEDGGQEPVGTAVVELVGCVAKAFSYSTDMGEDGRPYSFFDLKSGAVYEIVDSEWLLKVEEDVFGRAQGTGNGVRTAGKKKRTLLRHYVFTFHDTTFQCIAEGLKPKVSTESYGDIVADLALGD